jgi:hypothetical protein
MATRCGSGGAVPSGLASGTGDAFACLGARHYLVPPSQRLRAQQSVIAGGARQVPAATHIEWTVRRNTFAELLGWRFG